MAASTSVAAHWLVPNLPNFQQLHTGTRIKIVTTDRDIEPDHQVDITIWLRPRGFQRANTWCIGDEVIFPVCSPLYLTASRPISAVRDLLDHHLIHSFDPHRKRMGWNEWLGIVGVNAADLAPDLVLNDYQLSMQAALAGEGVALGWAFTCQLLLRNKNSYQAGGRRSAHRERFFRRSKREKYETRRDHAPGGVDRERSETGLSTGS
ncbi:LysR substrate-binding domain-containing protein (plasmid) [Sinorhizobium meliloti]|nr:LysR substrate-binding domain-containing protein [Sinorhizobium meliloti]